MNTLDAIFQAGVVGCGGAGFPTHAKLAGAGIRHLILNGAECEPLLRTDRYVMKNRAAEIVLAAETVRAAIGAEHCTISLKAGYTQEVAALQAAIAQANTKVVLHTMESFYPAGDEQSMVYEVTGLVVPAAGIPLDVGAVVCNVATMLAVSEALAGKPFTHKYLTITGEVANPTVAYVPVGTSFADCIALAGGATIGSFFVVEGGPMMGAPITQDALADAVVTKTTSAILVLPASSHLATQHEVSLAHMFNRARSACIQCRYCTELCPRYLLGHPLEPHMIMRKTSMSGNVEELLDDVHIRQAALCCECGICELYACPMELQPRRVNATIKKMLAAKGIRYPKSDECFSPREGMEYRKVPTKRAASRAGVLKYYDYRIENLESYTPERVRLPLKQHIGAPSVPVVAVGEEVLAGQLVAHCPEGALGANLHASISGTVVQVGSEIVIESGGRL